MLIILSAEPYSYGKKMYYFPDQNVDAEILLWLKTLNLFAWQLSPLLTALLQSA